MTKEEWVEETVEALEKVGYEVFYPKTLGGEIPMVKTPKDKLGFIKFKLPHGGQKRIFAEGILILPPGMRV